MKVLLDTHAWVWWLTAPDKLGTKGRKLVERSFVDSEVYLSAISVWEVAQLVRKGRFTVTSDLWDWLSVGMAIPGLRVIDLTPSIAYASTVLPGEFHADPADRIIVATARSLQATILTKDRQISQYPAVRVVW